MLLRWEEIIFVLGGHAGNCRAVKAGKGRRGKEDWGGGAELNGGDKR